MGHILSSKSEEKDEKDVVDNVRKIGGAKKREIDEEIRKVVEESRDLVIAYAKKKEVEFKVKKFEGIECVTQTVAGINYFLKICVDDGAFIHVFLWKKLDQSFHVLEVEFEKTLSDLLVFGG